MSDSEQTNEQTITLPILAFSSLLLKKKIPQELSNIPTTYNLYVIHQNESREWNLYLFIKDPSDLEKPINLSNDNYTRPFVTISDLDNPNTSTSSTESLLEKLLYTKIKDQSSIEDFTFSLKPEVKDSFQDLLDRFTIQAQSETIQDFNQSLGNVKEIYNEPVEPATRFVNALKNVLTIEQQSNLSEDSYKYLTNSAGNDCFFLSLAQSYVKSKNENLKNELKRRMSLSESTSIDTLQKEIRKFIADNITQDQISGQDKVSPVNEQIRQRVNNLEEYKEVIKTSEYQADELTIAILLKNHIFPFSLELNTGNKNTILMCLRYVSKPNLEELQNDTQENTSNNMIYFMLQYIPSSDKNSNHYELVGYEESPSDLKTLFFYHQLPEPIRNLVEKECRKPS
jgi:hypothetical protein